MGIKNDLMAAIPSLTDADFSPMFAVIVLQDDSDGTGAYIKQWNHSEPLPEQFKYLLRDEASTL
jgi:hypothetical protein